MKCMIEIIYNDTGKNGGRVIVKPPKNIRQIGSPRGRHKIYMEDYVCTFLHSAIFESGVQKRAAVLLGKSEVAQDIRYTFISSAILCEDVILRDQGILFDESSWEYIYKEIKEYFDGQDIVGWFLGMSGFPPELSPTIEAAHRKYFTGRDKILFLLDPSEGEDVFYAYEQGILQKKEGYYIYYEKNVPMQEYMVNARERQWESKTQAKLYPAVLVEEGMSNDGFGREAPLLEKAEMAELRGSGADAGQFRTEEEREFLQSDAGEVLTQEEHAKEEPFFAEAEKEASSEAQDDFFRQQEAGEEKRSADQAIQNYRHMLSERKAAPPQKRMNLLLYTAASAAMVVLCVIGITAINNYDKMRQVEEVLSVMSGEAGAKESGKEKKSGPMIESVPGEVTPKPDEAGNTGDTSGQSGTPAEGAEAGSTDPAGTEAGADAAGTPSGTEQSGTSSGTEAAGASSGTERSGASSGAEAAGAPSEMEQSGAPSGTDAAGAEAGSADATGAQAGTEQSGMSGTNAAGTEANAPAPTEGQNGSSPEAAGEEKAVQPQTDAAGSGQEGASGDGSETDGTTQSTDEGGQGSGESQETSAKVYLDQGYYIVQPGDKLELICRKIYNTTAMMEKLCEANQIEDTDKIFAGQKLILP